MPRGAGEIKVVTKKRNSLGVFGSFKANPTTPGGSQTYPAEVWYKSVLSRLWYKASSYELWGKPGLIMY